MRSSALAAFLKVLLVHLNFFALDVRSSEKIALLRCSASLSISSLVLLLGRSRFSFAIVSLRLLQSANLLGTICGRMFSLAKNSGIVLLGSCLSKVSTGGDETNGGLMGAKKSPSVLD